MDLADLAGRTFGPHRFHVGALAVSDFVNVIGDDPHRWARSAPPAFIAAGLFVVAPDLLGLLSDRSILHGEQTFTWSGPLVIGAELDVSGAVSRVRERGGVHFVGFDIVVADDGRQLAAGTSMFLVSGEHTVTRLEERPEPQVLARGPVGVDQVSMSRADLVRYAAATRDFNPIHWDHESAVAAGLPGVVVHGLAQAAWAMAAASRHRPGDQPLASTKVRFRNPLPPGTPVYIHDELNENAVSVSVTDDTTEFLSARIELAG